MEAYLLRLPMPIALPPMNDDWSPVDGCPALDRARRVLIGEQPISDEAKALYRHMLLDWLIAYDLAGFTQVAGASPWRLDALNAAHTRIMKVAELLDRFLGEPPTG